MSLEYTNNDTKILIDFLTFSVKVWDIETDLKPSDFNGDYDYSFLPDERALTEKIIQKFYLGNGTVDFNLQRARQGYSNLYSSNGITYAYGGCDTVMVQFSGTGCRYFETLNPGLDWYTFFWQLKAEFATMHISRLDIACDTFNLLNMSDIIDYSFSKKYVSIWRSGKVKQGIMDDHEKTVIFGSSKSDFLLRIYDKTAERLDNVTPDIAVPDGWVRCEFQFRNERACAFLSEWLKRQNIGQVYFGVMFDYLKFYSSYDGIHSDRLVLTKWWAKFLGNAQRVKLTYEGGLAYNLERLKTYVFHQAGSSIKTLLTLNGGDLNELLLGVDASKFNTRQEDLINLQKNLLAGAEHAAYLD